MKRDASIRATLNRRDSDRPFLRDAVRSRHFGRSMAMLVAASFVACNGPERPDREHYSVADRSTQVDITPGDLGIPSVSKQTVGVKVLSSEPSPGRFPAAICVARVVARADTETNKRHMRVADFSAHHKVHWNQLFDELSEVREVIFLTTGGLDPRGYDRSAVLNAAKVRGAELCVIYARLDSGESAADYMGALWDTRTMKPVLALRSVVVLPIEQAIALAAERDEDAGPQDPSVREADFRAEQDFRRMVRDAVWDMVDKDSGATSGDQNPWRGYVPPRDRPWKGLRDMWGE